MVTRFYEVGRPVAAKEGSDAKRRLLESALDLFSDKGYDATSIREIIEGAGVTRPVLYYYFQNKEDLFRRLVLTHFNEVIAYIDEIIASLPGCRERLEALICNTFVRAEQSPRTISLILQVCFSPSQQAPRLDKDEFVLGRFNRIARIMRDGLASRELAGGDAETLAVAFGGMMDMHLMARIYQPGARLTPDLGKALVDLFMRGACSPGWARGAAKSPFRFDMHRTEAR